MKVSDERLEELIDKVSVSSLPLYGLSALAAFRELQQLREERRWRKVSDEVPEKSCWCMYYQDGRISTGRCVVDDYGVTWLYGNGLLIPALANLFYRPLPTDLSEEADKCR